MKTEIAKDMDCSQARIQYDAQCKKVLSNKHILAWIMKAAIKEYSHLSIDFVRRCIEGQVQVLERAEESKEGMSTCDIQYAAYLPREADRIKILIHIETERAFDSGYPIESQEVCYGAHMISSQNEAKFQWPYDGDVKKVYLICICMKGSDDVGDVVSLYELSKKDIVEGISDRQSAYDKLSVVVICLSGKRSNNRGFFDMMNTLVSPTLDVESKKQILRNEYQILMETGFAKELNILCHLSKQI